LPKPSKAQFKSLIQPSHLLYNVIGFVIYKLLLTVGLKLRALTALQILDAVFSSVAAVVFFLTLKSAFRSLYLASWLTLLFGLSATWWKYSTDAHAYIVSLHSSNREAQTSCRGGFLLVEHVFSRTRDLLWPSHHGRLALST
jgi:hypothetical protein